MDNRLSEILGKILLLQSTIHAMGDNESLSRFVCRGLSKIPSLESVAILVNGFYFTDNPDLKRIEPDIRILFGRLPRNVIFERIHEDYLSEFQKRNNAECLLVATGLTLYGMLVVRTPDADLFRTILPYIENTMNLVALVLENNHQKELLLRNTLDLEYQVKTRTMELSSTNETLVDEIEERRITEEKFRRQSDFLMTLLETIPNPVFYKNKKGVYIGCNRAFESFMDLPRDRIIGKTLHDMVDIVSAETISRLDLDLFERGGNLDHETSVILKNDKTGTVRHLILNKAVIIDVSGDVSGIIGVISDITDFKNSEEERLSLKDQLIQAQKMESIGRLAGGIAHDFNNMITVILGNTELAMSAVAPGDALYENLHEIHTSANRSAALTRQLLAFARRQAISIRPLDLNMLVSGMIKMLERLIGENIDLIWRPGDTLWTVNMDPTQIDQILANLTVNARDAITGQGTMIIETRNSTVTRQDFCGKDGIDPGEYVLLTVSDSGCGMTEENLSHLFEPFYTTKEVGKGTGLGLATVYGIVKQNNGFVNVFSSPGKGTSFKIYFPRFNAVETPVQSVKDVKPAGGKETILLVEDEPAILHLGKTILKKYGYTVLTSQTPAEALALVNARTDAIDLLITDVVMPQMNGKELHSKIRCTHPDLRCLFISGYTADAISHHGVLNENLNFLQKPFTARSLAVKIREVLSETIPAAL